MFCWSAPRSIKEKHTVSRCLNKETKKQQNRDYIPSGVMKPLTQPIAHWRQKKLELSRASPPILSMWPCKNISHIQDLLLTFFQPQPRKLEIGTACRWEILIATGCYCSSSGFTGLKVINLIQDFQCRLTYWVLMEMLLQAKG